MAKFVVATINLFDNDLKQVIVEANTWQEAVKSVMGNWGFSECEDTQESWKEKAFNSDTLFNVLELT